MTRSWWRRRQQRRWFRAFADSGSGIVLVHDVAALPGELPPSAAVRAER